MSEPRVRRSDLLVAAILTLGILGPAVLRPGYILRGDMVFVPDQPWKPAWLGLDGSVPRSVPMDAIVWLFGQVLPGDVVQKLFLAASLLILALGVAHVLRHLGVVARVAAMTFACWNPWVYERLAIGQWACVLGLAALPWLVSAVVRRRSAAVAVWLLVAGVAAPSMGLIAVVVAVAVAATQHWTWRSWLALLGLSLAANAPWIMPALLRGGLEAPAGQFAGFGATAESGAGTLASVLSLGGIWKTSVVPAERTSAALVVVAVGVSLAALAALARRRGHVPGATGLLVAALASLILAAAPLNTLLADIARGVPAIGILRDSTRYLAPAVLAVALGFGLLVEEAVRRAKLAAALAALPVALLPSMAWGLHAFLEPSQYPSSWSAARTAMESHGVAPSVVLPWRGSYRGFAWTDGHAVLDPAPRFFPGDVLVDDRTFLSNRVIASEDPYLQRVAGALAFADPSSALRSLGIRWVIVEKGLLVDGARPQGTVTFDSPDLTLLDLGSPGPNQRPTPTVWLVVAADITAFAQFFPILLRNRVTRVTVRNNPGGRNT